MVQVSREEHLLRLRRRCRKHTHVPQPKTTHRRLDEEFVDAVPEFTFDYRRKIHTAHISGTRYRIFASRISRCDPWKLSGSFLDIVGNLSMASYASKPGTLRNWSVDAGAIGDSVFHHPFSAF